jgi:hypothetical protein
MEKEEAENKSNICNKKDALTKGVTWVYNQPPPFQTSSLQSQSQRNDRSVVRKRQISKLQTLSRGSSETSTRKSASSKQALNKQRLYI